MNVGFPLPTRVSAEPTERGFDLRKYLNFVWRHWIFIGAIAALALVVASHLPCASDATVHGKYPSPARAAARKGARRYQSRFKVSLTMLPPSRTSLQFSNLIRCYGELQ